MKNKGKSLNFKVCFLVFLLVTLGFLGPCGGSSSSSFSGNGNPGEASSQGEEDLRSENALSHQKESNFSFAPFFSLTSSEKIPLPDLSNQEIALISFKEDKNEKDKMEQIYFQYQILKEFFLFLCILKNHEKTNHEEPEEKNYPWIFEKIRVLKLEENSIPAKMQQAVLQYFNKPESSKQILKNVADTLEGQQDVGAKTFLAICYEQGIGREVNFQKSEVFKKEVLESFEKAGSTRFPFSHALNFIISIRNFFEFPYFCLDIRDFTLLIVCWIEEDLNCKSRDEKWYLETLNVMEALEKSLKEACFCTTLKDGVLSEIAKNWMTEFFKVMKKYLNQEYLLCEEPSCKGEYLCELMKYYILSEDDQLVSQAEKFIKNFLGDQSVSFSIKIDFIFRYRIQFPEKVKEWWKFLSGDEAYFQTRNEAGNEIEVNLIQMWTAMRIVIIGKRTLGLKENQLVDRMKAWLILERGREPLNGIFSSLEEEIEDLSKLDRYKLCESIVMALDWILITS